jgi:hypothetical protein
VSLRTAAGIASSLPQEFIRQGAGVHANAPENARLERRSGAGLLKNGSQVFLQCLKDHGHLPHCWLVAIPHEGTQQLAEHPGRSAPVRVDVCSAQVAQRFLKPPGPGLEDKPGMFSVRTTGVVPNRETQLKGHVETWGWRRSPVQLNPGHIMDGILAGLHERQDPVQPASTAWDLESRPWDQTERAGAGDIGEKETAETSVVRKI